MHPDRRYRWRPGYTGCLAPIDLADRAYRASRRRWQMGRIAGRSSRCRPRTQTALQGCTFGSSPPAGDCTSAIWWTPCRPGGRPPPARRRCPTSCVFARSPSRRSQRRSTCSIRMCEWMPLALTEDGSTTRRSGGRARSSACWDPGPRLQRGARPPARVSDPALPEPRPPPGMALEMTAGTRQ